MPVTTTAVPRLCALPQLQGIAWADIYQRRADGSYCSSFTTAAAVPGAQNAKLLARHGRFAALARLEHTVVRKRTAGTCVEQEPADDMLCAACCVYGICGLLQRLVSSKSPPTMRSPVAPAHSSQIRHRAPARARRPRARSMCCSTCWPRVYCTLCATRARLDRVLSGPAAGRDRHV